MRTKTYLTIEQLEGLKTHELADLLGNIALLLRRMPDVACGELIQPIPSDDVFMAVEVPPRAAPSSQFTQVDLKNKRKKDLQKIASDWSIFYTSRTTNEELISKILARAASGHSEQYTIRDL